MSDSSNPCRKSKYNPELRKYRISIGLCGRCGKGKNGATTANCIACIDRVRALRQIRRENGICVYCKQSAMPGVRYCLIHNKAERQRQKKRLADDALTVRHYTKAFKNRRVSLGMCLRCESTDLITQRYCGECALKVSEDSRRQRAAIKQAAINGYGGRCSCCGESVPQFLVIDHKYNDGAYERRTQKLSGSKIYYYVVRNRFPEKYQVLCYNCNNARAHYGQCPHQK